MFRREREGSLPIINKATTKVDFSVSDVGGVAAAVGVAKTTTPMIIISI